jgi:hypothetical protein
MCAQSHGPVVGWSTAGELRSLVTGAWLFCSGPTVFVGGGMATSLLFSTDGTLHSLLPDGQGGLTADPNILDVRMWWLECNGVVNPSDGTVVATNACLIDWRYVVNGGSDGFNPVSFEAAPQRMELVSDLSDGYLWYLALH